MRFINWGIMALTLLSAGCSQAPSVYHTRWSARSGSKLQLPAAVHTVVDQIKADAHIYKVGGLRVTRGRQVLGSAEIEDSWYQSIQDESGQLTYVGLNVVGELPGDLSGRVESLVQRAPQYVANLREQSVDLKQAKWIADPKVILKRDNNHLSPYVRLEYLVKNESEAREFLINEQGRVRAHNQIGFHAVDGLATVFPNDPSRSHLSEQILPELEGDGTLTGRFVRALSALDASPFNLRNDFRFTPNERTFDDVQAYFFADQQIRWFDQMLGVRLANRLEVKVHLAGNAMFYYQNQVRLGDGDGESWSGIARDPSIVKHEVSHAYVEMLSGLPFQGQGGSFSEGFADFFSASNLNSPRMADYAYLKGDFRRTLENTSKAYINFNNGVYNDSLVVSGTFWDIRKALGPDKSLRLAKAFLLRIGPGGLFKDFAPVIDEAAQVELSSADRAVAMKLIEERGWLQGAK